MMNKDNITESFALPVTGSVNGSTITWLSDNEAVIKVNGNTADVMRPTEDTQVKLTATAKIGASEKTKDITVTVKGMQASREIREIKGVEDSYFGGGIFYETAAINFADMFEGDGSNGTNGTVPYEKDGKTEGLKAQKTDGGIKFSRAGTEGANPGRAQAILDVTYPLPEIENPNAPYYVELSFQACVSSAVNFDFGQNEGNDGVLLGNNGVVRVRKLDSYTGSDGVAAPIEGPAAYAYSTDDIIRAKAEYSEGENATIGLYVIPALKEMVFYKDGEMISDKIYTYSDLESVLETLRVTWYQSIRWYNIPKSDYLTLKGVKVYQGPDLSDEERLKFDAEGLTFDSISDEKANLVTKDLNLYTVGNFGSDIAWSSSDENVINPNTGVVIRGEMAKTVTLTAVLRSGEMTDSKTFVVTVLRKGLEGNILKGADVTIEETSSIESLENLTDGIFETYIATMDEGIKPKIIIDMGEAKQFSKMIIYEGMVDGDYSITNGVIEVSNDNWTWTKVGETGIVGANRVVEFIPVEARYIRFSVTGLKEGKTVVIYEVEAVIDASDADIVKADIRDLKAFDSYSVTESTKFVSKGSFGSDIGWESKNPELADNMGNVYRPSGSGEEVTITATVSYGAASSTISFNHFIVGKGSSSSSGGSSSSYSGSRVSGIGGLVTVNSDSSLDQNGGQIKTDSGFNDVDTDSWAYAYINVLYENGIIAGNGSGFFEPTRFVTREEFLKLLLLAIDEDIIKDAENVFSDVEPYDWFADYINTAYKMGLVNGMPDGSFGVGNEITRQDMAVLVMRAVEYKGIVLETEEKKNLTDIDNVSNYAKESVQNLANAAIISGDENAIFNPTGFASREEAAKIICLIYSENRRCGGN